MKEKEETPAKELEEIRAFLGEAGAGYSDSRLLQLYRDIFAMAELLLDVYVARKRAKSSRKPPDLTSDSPELLLR